MARILIHQLHIIFYPSPLLAFTLLPLSACSFSYLLLSQTFFLSLWHFRRAHLTKDTSEGLLSPHEAILYRRIFDISAHVPLIIPTQPFLVCVFTFLPSLLLFLFFLLGDWPLGDLDCLSLHWLGMLGEALGGNGDMVGNVPLYLCCGTGCARCMDYELICGLG